MAMAEIPNGSVQYVRATVTSGDDLTSGTVEFGYAAYGAMPSSWTSGTWPSGAVQSSGPVPRWTMVARALLNTGTLTVGTEYVAWLRIVDSPETLLIRAGYLKVT